MNRTLLFWLLLLCIQVLINLRVEAAKSKPEVRMDTAKIIAKSIPAQKLEKFRQAPDFNYQEKVAKGNSFWQYLLQKILNSFGRVFNNRISEIFFYIIFIAIFVLLLVVLFGGDIQAILIRNKGRKINIPVISEDSIDNIDFDKIIKSEIDNGNYNRAVRYLYLKLLQLLTGRGLIVWQKEKTNRDYFRELLSTSYSPDFRSITSAYEYVWYGKFPLDKENFEGVYKNFNDFYKKLNA